MPGPETSSQTVHDPRAAANTRRVILITYLIAAMDMTCLFLQISITPYLAKRLGFDTLWFGYLQTMVGIFELFGCPLFGRFGDLFGARAAFTLSSSASIVFFVLLALANSVPMLFIQKLPTLFMHTLSGAQMVVADLTEPDQRADSLAKLGLCFGVGMTAGSFLGGMLSTRYGDTITAAVAACVCFINLLLVLNFIPKHTKKQTNQDPASSQDPAPKAGGSASVFNLGHITRLMRYPGVAKTFTIKIISDLPGGIFQSMFSIIAMNFFQLQASQTGHLMAYFGVVQMVVQGGVIGWLTRRYSDHSLLLLAIGTTSLVGLGQALMSNVFQFCLIIPAMTFSLSVFGVIMDSMLSKSVPSSDTGTMLGLCASEMSLVRTVGPTIGGFLYENYGVPSFGFMQFVVNVAVFLYMLGSDVGRAETHRN
ncbi:solute carrier family 22 member 18 [Conger conger]|uniref:solute carrier family 22 member 18 n=1 Tax=Conger conger TaxID=82655 RepID=UPI002A5A3B02|nr:solute carrier family 22 member 18 [Conger conger]